MRRYICVEFEMIYCNINTIAVAFLNFSNATDLSLTI